MKWYALLFLSIVIEAVVTYAGTLFVDRRFQWQIAAAMLLGVSCALAFGVDLFAVAGVPAAANPVVSTGTLLPERIRTAQTAKAYGTPVARDESKDQLEIVSSVVNARLYPTLSGSRWGYAARGIYNIHDRAEADGYVWYLLEPDVNGIGDALWVAYSPDWAALHLADTGSATLESEIAQLRAQLKTAQAEAARLTKIVETVRAAVA